VKYAVDFVLGTRQVIVVDALNVDDAYDVGRSELRRRKLYSAAIVGTARLATQADVDASLQ